MTRLPIVSGRKLFRTRIRLGYYIRDQKGSHVHLRHPDKRPLTIPMHDELDRGTLKGILKDADISIEEFLGMI
jgi:predicted RNA binding protein YcfA (HicA-like mRNA interferase family)